MKKILWAVLALVVVLIALVLAHPLWIGPVVRTVATSVAPKMLGVPVQLDGFSLNAYTGRLVIEGLVLDNPPACGTQKFVKIDRLCLDVDPFTVCSDPIVVDEISVSNLYVSIVTDDKSVYNYQLLAGGSEKKTAEAKSEKPAPEKKPEVEKKPAPKVIIDLIDISGAMVQWQKVPLPLPSFRMTGIGRSTPGGVEFEAAWDEFSAKFLESFGPLAKGLKDGLAGTQKALDEGVKQLNDATKKLNDVTSKSVSGATKSVTGVTKTASSLTTKSVEGTTKSVTDATKAVGDVSTKAVEKTTKALDDGVKSLKSLFK